MQNTKRIFIHLFIFLILIVPAISLAADFVGPCPEGTVNNGTACVPVTTTTPSSTGLVPCDNVKTPCDFNQLMALVNKVIKFVLYDMVVPIAAIMFAYAGFELVTSGGSTEKRATAKNVFTNAAIGLVIAVGAFLIIKTLLSILGFKGDWIGF